MKKTEQKRSFKIQAAQGDILIRRVTGIPSDCRRIESPGNRHVLAHSETGHHHVVHSPHVEFWATQDPRLSYIDVAERVELRHEREFDTHETLYIDPGIYEIRRQRERVPGGWERTVVD